MRGRHRARRGDAGQRVAGRRQRRLFEVRVRLQAGVPVDGRVALQVVPPQPPEARLVAHVVQGGAVAAEAVGAAALLPGRLPDVGAVGGEHAVAAVAQVVQIEVAPARRVGHVGQVVPVRREGGLEDGGRFASGKRLHVVQAGQAVAAGAHRGRPEQRAVPGHLGMVPLHPGDALSPAGASTAACKSRRPRPAFSATPGRPRPQRPDNPYPHRCARKPPNGGRARPPGMRRTRRPASAVRQGRRPATGGTAGRRLR